MWQSLWHLLAFVRRTRGCTWLFEVFTDCLGSWEQFAEGTVAFLAAKPPNLSTLQLYKCLSVFSLYVQKKERDFLWTPKRNKARLGHNIRIWVCFEGKALLPGFVYAQIYLLGYLKWGGCALFSLLYRLLPKVTFICSTIPDLLCRLSLWQPKGLAFWSNNTPTPQWNAGQAQRRSVLFNLGNLCMCFSGGISPLMFGVCAIYLFSLTLNHCVCSKLPLLPGGLRRESSCT